MSMGGGDFVWNGAGVSLNKYIWECFIVVTARS